MISEDAKVEESAITTTTTTTMASQNGTVTQTVEKMEIQNTTTTTTTVTTKSITTISENCVDTAETKEEPMDIQATDDKSSIKQDSTSNHNSGIDDKTGVMKSEMNGDIDEQNLKPVVNNLDSKIDPKSGIQILTPEQKSTIMNVQSVCPNVKQTVLKVADSLDSHKSGQTRTVLIVNRDGNKVTLAVSKQPVTSSSTSSTDSPSVIQQQSTTTMATTLAG